MENTALVKEWEERIVALSSSFKDAFGALSEAQLQQKPKETAWSIAQNLEHLIRNNESYYTVFENLKNNTLNLPILGKWMHKLFGKMILKSVNPDRAKKIKTFKIWEPEAVKKSGTTLDAFLNHQESFAVNLESLVPFVNEDPVIHSPANKTICFSLSMAMDIILTHEERHLNQALEVKRALSL